MKRLMFALAVSAALATALPACGSECDKKCTAFKKCMTDLSGGKLAESERRFMRDCKKQCRNDRKKFDKGVSALCGR